MATKTTTKTPAKKVAANKVAAKKTSAKKTSTTSFARARPNLWLEIGPIWLERGAKTGGVVVVKETHTRRVKEK